MLHHIMLCALCVRMGGRRGGAGAFLPWFLRVADGGGSRAEAGAGRKRGRRRGSRRGETGTGIGKE